MQQRTKFYADEPENESRKTLKKFISKQSFYSYEFYSEALGASIRRYVFGVAYDGTDKWYRFSGNQIKALPQWKSCELSNERKRLYKKHNKFKYTLRKIILLKLTTLPNDIIFCICTASYELFKNQPPNLGSCVFV